MALGVAGGPGGTGNGCGGGWRHLRGLPLRSGRGEERENEREEILGQETAPVLLASYARLIVPAAGTRRSLPAGDFRTAVGSSRQNLFLSKTPAPLPGAPFTIVGMADAEKLAASVSGGHSKGLDEVLKPFYQRASEAEERLARLEAVLANKSDDCNSSEELSAVVKDFQSKLEMAQHELTAEREKASKEIQRLTAENAKLQYRMVHLVRALKDADSKLGA
ncbi:hypothetical protein Taro_009079 [Colocasia esculenta]|uniref:Uncharacterized protein n=1 Tax=Colocasia esculenta TaxID=4460 RepID=A0A843U5D5_COLES|nr:hypothetical protein [Colocasia esculenta]